MKKILSIAACALLVGISATAAFATTTSSQSGNTVTISVGNVTGASSAFTYTTSPNVQIKAKTSATSYAAKSANTNTDADNGMVYGVVAGNPGYAQRQKTSAEANTGPSDVTDESTLDSETWQWMGASS